MKKPFQVGDRVAVYGHGGIGWKRWTGRVLDPTKGAEILGPDFIRVEIEKLNEVVHAHEKQCRRLVKKPRRRVWLGEDDMKEKGLVTGWGGIVDISATGKPEKGFVEFIEVRRK
jgi:hypothetical protein